MCVALSNCTMPKHAQSCDARHHYDHATACGTSLLWGSTGGRHDARIYQIFCWQVPGNGRCAERDGFGSQLSWRGLVAIRVARLLHSQAASRQAYCRNRNGCFSTSQRCNTKQGCLAFCVPCSPEVGSSGAMYACQRSTLQS